MTVSMYEISVPVFVRGLENLKAVLEIAVAHAERQDLDPAVLLASRLYPDMFNLTRQIQIATDLGRRAVARLAGLEVPGSEDDEVSFAQLIARVEQAIGYLKAAPKEGFAQAEGRAISLRVSDRTLNFIGLAYLLDFAFPNFFFHLATAYNILRHNGVPLGKSDFLGSMP